MRKISFAVVLLSLLFLAGCNLGPKYNRPTFHPPANFYTVTEVQQISVADQAWWDLFKDPVLQGLIREALQNNYDLQSAVARVDEERSLLGVARSQYYPQVAYGAGITG